MDGGIVDFRDNIVDTALEMLGSQHPPSLYSTLPTIRMTHLEFTSVAAFKIMVSMLSLSRQHLWRRVPELPCGTHQKRPRPDIMRLLHENSSQVNSVAFASNSRPFLADLCRDRRPFRVGKHITGTEMQLLEEAPCHGHNMLDRSFETQVKSPGHRMGE